MITELVEVLKYVTGGRTLPKRIHVAFDESAGIAASTCAMKITLPLHVDASTFSTAMRAVLFPGRKSFTMI